ncbi:MAG: tetratricopeptide repeat protein [Bacteroidetes bacterium]|nr:tetratricopeptide repeat protein [Bacteroidota bacterium]
MDCTNPDMEKLIARYEFGLLTEDERKAFEAHILQCDKCFGDLYSMSDVYDTMKENSEELITLLEESIEGKKEIKSFQSKRQKKTDNKISRFLTSLALLLWVKHRIRTISISLVVLLMLTTLITWDDFFGGKKTIEIAHIKKAKTEKISKEQQTIIKEETDIAEANIKDYSSLANIQKIPYKPLSLMNTRDINEADNPFIEGMELYNANNYREAIKKLDTALTKDTNKSEINFYLGLCYLLDGKPNRAIRRFQIVIKIDTTKIFTEKANWYLGNAYLLTGDGAKALKAFEKTAAMNGEYKRKAKVMIKKINEVK